MLDVVITGIGIACPLGIGRQAVWQAVENRESGISGTIDRQLSISLHSMIEQSGAMVRYA